MNVAEIEQHTKHLFDHLRYDLKADIHHVSYSSMWVPFVGTMIGVDIMCFGDRPNGYSVLPRGTLGPFPKPTDVWFVASSNDPKDLQGWGIGRSLSHALANYLVSRT